MFAYNAPYTFLLKSEDRVYGSNTDLQIQPYPRELLINSFTLKAVNLPFPFKNITERYGNRITLQFHSPSQLVTLLVDVVLPEYYYSIPQLLTAVNQSLADSLNPLQLSAVFSISPFNNRIQLNVTGSLTSNPILFQSLVTADYHGRTHMFSMLGLPTVTTDIGVLDSSNQFTLTLPYSFTQDLPFRWIFITIGDIANRLYSSNQLNTTFVVDVSHYRPPMSINQTQILDSKTLVYYPNTSYSQSIKFDIPFKLRQMNVRLTDENSNPIDVHAENRNWTMLVKIGISSLQ